MAILSWAGPAIMADVADKALHQPVKGDMPEELYRLMTLQPFPLIALQPPAVRLTQESGNDFIIDFDQRRVESSAKRT